MGKSGERWLKVVNLHIMNRVIPKIIVYLITNYIVHIHSVKTNFPYKKNTLSANKTLTYVSKPPYIIV